MVGRTWHICTAKQLHYRAWRRRDSTSTAAGSPDVTHVLYPFGVRGDPDDGKTYMRSLERR